MSIKKQLFVWNTVYVEESMGREANPGVQRQGRQAGGGGGRGLPHPSVKEDHPCRLPVNTVETQKAAQSKAGRAAL